MSFLFWSGVLRISPNSQSFSTMTTVQKIKVSSNCCLFGPTHGNQEIEDEMVGNFDVAVGMKLTIVCSCPG